MLVRRVRGRADFPAERATGALVTALLDALARTHPAHVADRAAVEARRAADAAADNAKSASIVHATLRSSPLLDNVSAVDLRLAAELADRYEAVWAEAEETALRAADEARLARRASALLMPSHLAGERPEARMETRLGPRRLSRG